MNFVSRSANYLKDKEQIVALFLRYQASPNAYLFPTAWRIRLLLSSRVWNPQEDTRIWEDNEGRMVAFAMLWRRFPTSPYLVLDWFVDSDKVTENLLDAIVAWGVERMRVIAAESSVSITLYTSRLQTDVYSERQLAKYGFTLLKPNPIEHNVFFARLLHDDIPKPNLPPGYKIRELRSLADLEAYAEVYGFAEVSHEHQQEMLNSEEYVQLVVENPTGKFDAYGECSFSRRAEVDGQPQAMIDYIGTCSESRRQGLGRALLLTMLQRLQAAGAGSVMLVTVNTNIPAVELYRAVGFKETHVPEANVYEMQLNE